MIPKNSHKKGGEGSDGSGRVWHDRIHTHTHTHKRKMLFFSLVNGNQFLCKFFFLSKMFSSSNGSRVCLVVGIIHWTVFVRIKTRNCLLNKKTDEERTIPVYTRKQNIPQMKRIGARKIQKLIIEPLPVISPYCYNILGMSKWCVMGCVNFGHVLHAQHQFLMFRLQRRRGGIGPIVISFLFFFVSLMLFFFVFFLQIKKGYIKAHSHAHTQCYSKGEGRGIVGGKYIMLQSLKTNTVKNDEDGQKKKRKKERRLCTVYVWGVVGFRHEQKGLHLPARIPYWLLPKMCFMRFVSLR